MNAGKAKHKILIVDDSQVARRMLISQLAELGFKDVVEATNGTEGVQRLLESRAKKAPFSLIITDLRMPSMSGTDFIKKISEEADFKQIPKLIASVETERGTVLNAVLTGAAGYILKPTTVDVLKAKLAKVFAA